jgi:NitT/TauT family transport system permease protein
LPQEGVDLASRPDSPVARSFDWESVWIVLGRIALALFFIGVWQVASGPILDPFYFSSPFLIARQIVFELIDPSFYRDLWVTAVEFVLGYGIGGLLGIALGILLARWRIVARLVDPFLIALNSIPRIAFAPMLIVWFGIDMSSKVFLAATLVFFITFFSTLSGVRGVDRALCDVARLQGATERQIFMKVIIPSASSWILTGLKMSLPFALAGVILGEFLVSSKGLGYRLNHYSTVYDMTGAITMIIIMMIIMMGLTILADWADARIMRWRPKEREAGGTIARA